MVNIGLILAHNEYFDVFIVILWFAGIILAKLLFKLFQVFSLMQKDGSGAYKAGGVG